MELNDLLLGLLRHAKAILGVHACSCIRWRRWSCIQRAIRRRLNKVPRCNTNNATANTLHTIDLEDEEKTLRRGSGTSTQIHIDAERRLDIFGQRKSILVVRIAILEVLPKQADSDIGCGGAGRSDLKLTERFYE